MIHNVFGENGIGKSNTIHWNGSVCCVYDDDVERGHTETKIPIEIIHFTLGSTDLFTSISSSEIVQKNIYFSTYYQICF